MEDRCNYLIVILGKEVEVEDLDKTMRQYVRTNTYLSEDSLWFWEKLWRALPRNPIATLPGGERDEGWCGVYALARAQDEEYMRALQIAQEQEMKIEDQEMEDELADNQLPEIEMGLAHNQVRYHRQGVPNAV